MGTIVDKVEYLQDTKEAIKAALIERGQIVTSADSFRSYAGKIRRIDDGGSGAVLIEKTITENGVYNAEDDDADGYSKVTVDAAATLITKTISDNGTYNAASDNADGYSAVTVNVSGYSKADVEAILSDFPVKHFLVPFYTSATNPEGYTMTYSHQNGASTPAWAIFTDVINAVWNPTWSNARWTTNQANQWVQIKLPEAKAINGFWIANVIGASGSNDTFCRKYKVQASDNGMIFTDIYEEELANELIAKCVFLDDETSAYQYYRVVVEESYHTTYYGLSSFFPMHFNWI